MAEAYGGDFASLSSTESAGSALSDLGFDPADYANGIKTGDSADTISGIQKTGDYGVKVTLTEPDATAIYQLGVPIAPLHYYGEPDKYDYDPSDLEILERVLPQYMVSYMCRVLLETEVADNAARLMAMDNATRNAGEMLKGLQKQYRRTRQSKITTDLIEIVSGAMSEQS
jgi:F0F1-type ATP synthase gamma subunit